MIRLRHAGLLQAMRRRVPGMPPSRSSLVHASPMYSMGRNRLAAQLRRLGACHDLIQVDEAWSTGRVRVHAEPAGHRFEIRREDGNALEQRRTAQEIVRTPARPVFSEIQHSSSRANAHCRKPKAVPGGKT